LSRQKRRPHSPKAAGSRGGPVLVGPQKEVEGERFRFPIARRKEARTEALARNPGRKEPHRRVAEEEKEGEEKNPPSGKGLKKGFRGRPDVVRPRGTRKKTRDSGWTQERGAPCLFVGRGKSTRSGLSRSASEGEKKVVADYPKKRGEGRRSRSSRESQKKGSEQRPAALSCDAQGGARRDLEKGKKGGTVVS